MTGAPEFEIKILDPRLHQWGLPSYHSEMAAGLDLRACIDSPLALEPQAPAVMVPSGVAILINRPGHGCAGVAAQRAWRAAGNHSRPGGRHNRPGLCRAVADPAHQPQRNRHAAGRSSIPATGSPRQCSCRSSGRHSASSTNFLSRPRAAPAASARPADLAIRRVCRLNSSPLRGGDQ